MNKLISRNPVLRFKEEKKIVKGLYGIPNGIYYETKLGDALIDSGRYFGGKKVSMPIALGTYYEKKDSNGNIIERGRYVGSKQQAFQNNLETQNSRKIETTSKQNIPISNPKSRKPLTTNRIISKYSNRKSELGGKSVKDWQNILKNYYAPGTYKNDGIWGDNTDAAYRKYLTITNTDFTPISKEPIEIPNNENNNVNFDYEKFKRAALASDYTPDSIEQKLVSTPITYNRSMTRDWLRNNIGTAYGVSGAMRAAARRKLNGLATDDDITLIKSNLKLYDALKNAGLFKKGGQLPSRNVVERFKNGGVLKFLNAGNLPTAPKAEKRFRKSSYNTTKDGNRETTTITSQTFGYNRNWPYFRQPATILRIVEHGDTAFVETPEHHIFTKVLPRTALKSGNVYVEYNPKYDKNYSLGGQANTLFNYSVTPLEYETLKRRFNTAWNLAK